MGHQPKVTGEFRSPVPIGGPDIATIRPAEPSDLTGITRLVADAYAPWIARIGKKPGPMLDDYAARISAGEAFVTDGSDGILGLVIIIPQDDALLLDNVAVAQKAQGKGIGRDLVGFAEARAARSAHRRLRLYAHEKMTENIALYTRLGFQETHRVTEHGFARVYMEKRLAPK